MRSYISKAIAFVVRDFRIESGYQAAFVMGLLESIMLMIILRFIGRLIPVGASASLGQFGRGFFPFALIGVAFARYFNLMLGMFSQSIREAQMTGCLEAMLSSQTGPITVVTMSSLYSLLTGGLQLALVLGGGVLLFGVDLSTMNWPATIVVLVFSVAIFGAFGILSAAAIVWLKKGDPITWVLAGLGSILGGAYFPVDVMPGWMQKLSLIIPIRYSLDALRATMLNGANLAEVIKPVGTLVVMAVVLLPASTALFTAAVRKGRREGTLTQY